MKNPINPTESIATKLLLVFLAYGLAYIVFFQLAGYMHGLAGYSLWFPAAGLRFALIFTLGWRYGLLIAFTEIAALGVVGDWATWSYRPHYIFFGSGSSAFVCALVVWGLERFKLTNPKLEALPQLIWFVSALVITPLLAAPVVAGIKVYGDRVLMPDLQNSIMSYWVGDMVGMLMFATLIIIGYQAYKHKSWRELKHLIKPAFILEYLAAVTFIWLTLQYAGGGSLSLRWIPFFIPVVVISLRHGLPAAALIILALNIMVVDLGGTLSKAQLFEHQGFLALISALGLLLGGIMSIRLKENAEMQNQHKTLAQLDRRNTMGDMAVQIIHELAQPTSITSIYAKESAKMLASGKHTKEQIKQSLDNIALHTDRLNAMIKSMKRFAMTGDLTRAKTDTTQLLSDVRDLINIYAKTKGVKVEYVSQDKLPLFVDEVQIQQAIMNLTKNAVEAMEKSENKLLTINAYGEGGWVCISVKDTGSGMPKGIKDNETTKPTGMGLGLRITKEIVEAHGGKLNWKSPNEVVILLPSLS